MRRAEAKLLRKQKLLGLAVDDNAARFAAKRKTQIEAWRRSLGGTEGPS